MAKPSISMADLPDEMQAFVKATGPRKGPSLSMDKVRGHALEVLFPIRSLSKVQRDRVLRHALKVNKV
jgi:hypothetical protein